jgi:outer membrane protein OmpA-like peptidoglycan-associated protein
MMQRRTAAILIPFLAVALVASTGCVSKKLFRKNVEDTDTRVASAESAIESNERRIGDLKTETDSKIAALEGQTEKAVEVGNAAMSRADQAAEVAEKAALGRLLWSVTLSDERVKFSFNQAALPDEARAVLDDLAGRIKGYGKAVYVEIEGHTDNTGSQAYNMTLGAKRAMAVRDYLSKEGGIPLHAINTISYGESRPVADNDSSDGRSRNRRVVVRVLE